MFKKKITIVLLFIFAFVCVMPVSAESKYITLDDYGWGCCVSDQSVSTSSIYNLHYISDTSSYSTKNTKFNRLFSYWSFPIQQDYTYTCTFQCVITGSSYLSPSQDASSTAFFTNNLIPESSSDELSITDDKIVVSLNRVSTGVSNQESVTLTVSFNPTFSEIAVSQIYLYGVIFFNSDGQTYTISSWGCSAEYDPGGSDFEDLYNEISRALDDHDDRNRLEADTEGNDTVKKATSVLTEALPISSISDAIAPLVTACGYEGTSSVWTFPALKIPAIAGLFGEMNLSSDQTFDLCEYAESYIPDELLSLIRALMTVFLIFWAIREVMGLLSSLLGGG